VEAVMLQYADAMIGFAMVMLVVSLAVTTITQIIVGLLNLRGAALKSGITELLVLIDRGVHPKEAREITNHILRDPLVGQTGIFGLGRRLATVVQREELTKLLLGFGLDPAEHAQAPRSIGSSAAGVIALQKTLRKSLERNGIADPDTTLKNIRMAALALEKAHPELSNSARANSAILDSATSEFLGKLNAWFDQTIDRVSDAFAGRTRIVAAVVAVLLAATLQLNAIGLINRLSTDSVARGKLVDAAIAQAKANPSKPEAGVASHLPTVGSSAPLVVQAVDLLGVPGSSTDWEKWWKNWTDATLDIGVALSALMLSLGAPFWYGALNSLLKLRSVLATKDDDQRTERQSTQKPG
jgi:hypothetical protein